jgi:3-oxoacyl-[acyl-carrier protein] reductase
MPRMDDLERDSILVTGASRGIGRAVALKLAASGHDIAINYVNSRAKAEAVAGEVRELGANCRLLRFDISHRNETREVLEGDVEEHGAYYGVVCNAGINRDNAFPMMSGNEWDDVLHTNLDGFYNVLNPLIMPMIRRRSPGRIVAISSIAGITGNRGQVNYSAAKAGIIGAVKALALELAKRKITVNCVAPGLILTDMTESLPIEEIKKQIPMGRLGTPEDVAGIVAFICSPEAAYMTRQVIAVDGGLI